MINSDLPEINLFGEKLVEKWLLENEYLSVNKVDLLLNNFCFHAVGKMESILVQYKTFVHPNRPFNLSEYEIDMLTRKAANLDLVAYVAYVVIDQNGHQLGEIIWKRLD